MSAPHRILLVDDDPEQRDAIACFLELEGSNVMAAPSLLTCPNGGERRVPAHGSLGQPESGRRVALIGAGR